ncbi:hypothetical protein K4F52_008716 [Lecanicillium sp. MT-2017a]|nr:hypothetical protein K4F52_008716 [Lecanicillium sp. MT-2017a]
MLCATCRAAAHTLRVASRTQPFRTAAAAATTRPLNRRALLPQLAQSRLFSNTRQLRSDAEISMTDAEQSIANILTEKLQPTEVLVQDVSGGCGSMYAIEIASHQFKGQTMLKQQRMVNAALGDLVKSWHGVQIRTKVPDA